MFFGGLDPQISHTLEYRDVVTSFSWVTPKARKGCPAICLAMQHPIRVIILLNPRVSEIHSRNIATNTIKIINMLIYSTIHMTRVIDWMYFWLSLVTYKSKWIDYAVQWLSLLAPQASHMQLFNNILQQNTFFLLLLWD